MPFPIPNEKVPENSGKIERPKINRPINPEYSKWLEGNEQKVSDKRYPFDKNNPIVGSETIDRNLNRPPVGGYVEKLPITEVRNNQMEFVAKFTQKMDFVEAVDYLNEVNVLSREISLDNKGEAFDSRTVLLNAIHRVGGEIVNDLPVAGEYVVTPELWQAALQKEIEIYNHEVNMGYHDNKFGIEKELDELYVAEDYTWREDLSKEVVTPMYRNRGNYPRLAPALRRAVSIMRNDDRVKAVLNQHPNSEVAVIQGLMQMFLSDSTRTESHHVLGDPSLSKSLEVSLLASTQNPTEEFNKLNDGSITYELPRYAW